MAEKRMFSMKVVDSDEFLELPPGAQNLYFHLSMRADDDGFVGNPRTVARVIGAGEEDLNLLIGSGFVLSFGGRVVAIRHWRIHNSLRREYYVPTRYLMQLETLSVLPDGTYGERAPDPGPK